MTYDLAGNLITDSYSGAGARTYDAENRMITSADYTGQTSRYTYDAEGRRVRRQVASSQEEWQIFGFDGELLAEYRASTAASAPEKEYGYRNGELLVTATGRYNVALASNGATASASSAHTCCGFSTWGAINGNNRGPWGNGEGWNDATQGVVPDWIQVDFAGSKTIDEVSVFSLHDNYTAANTPTEAQTFSLYGLLGFDVQYWNGSSWVTIPNGSVTGNNKVWRKFTFSAVTTSKIRVYINTVPDSWSRVVEIQAFGTSAGGEKVQWLVADHLGTPRMIVDQTGTLASVRRHDYLPFGEELFAGIGGRTVSSGYSADGVRQQFIAKERDVETGLDYFGARYYASVQGRFTSADPITMTVGRLMDPQRLNLYSHCRNNPEKFIDSSGEDLLLANQVAHERARANIDARLRPEERKNIDIVGDKVVLKDPAAINVSTSTNAYRGLAAVIQNHNAIVNYYGLKPGDTVQLRLPAATTEGPVLNQLTYQDVHDRGGVTIPYVTEGSTVIIYDVYVTTATDLHVLGTDNVTLVSMPEEIVFYHEVAGHAGGLDLPQTIAFENAVRQDTGVPNLPPRSGLDHTGQVVVASPDLIQVPPPTVPKNYLIIRPLKKREEIP
jgi:RHS repeat-associated protein